MAIDETRAPGVRLLVTGSQGFVGRHVRAAVARRGAVTVGVDRPGTGAEIEVDLAAPELDVAAVWDRALAGGPIASVIFMAANITRTSSVDASAQSNLRLIAEVPARLLEEGARRGACVHVVDCSTFKIFGPQKQPLIDPATHPRRPDPFSYGSAKALGERLLAIASRRAGFTYAMVHPTCIYGPGQHRQNAIPTFLRAALAGERPKVFGTGASVRDDVFAPDLADVLVEAALRRATGSFNAAGERGRTILEVARMCAEAVSRLSGKPALDVVTDPSRPEKWWLDQTFDLEPPRRAFGYRPTPLSVGLDAETAWVAAGEPADTTRFVLESARAGAPEGSS